MNEDTVEISLRLSTRIHEVYEQIAKLADTDVNTVLKVVIARDLILGAKDVE